MRTILLATVAGLAILTVAGRPQAVNLPALSVDTATTGNSSSTVGAIQPCRSVAVSSGPSAIDIVIQNVTSLSGFEADLGYDESVLTITATQTSFILGTGIILDLSDPAPDIDGNNKFHILLATTGSGSGSGVVIRLTLEPKPGVAGTSWLDLKLVRMKDINNNNIQPADGQGFYTGPINDGWIVIGGPCGSPPPSPTPVPDYDGDGIPDSSDNCMAWYNPSQNLPAWPVPPDDPDCDGWATAAEQFIGTNSMLACGANAWPPDISNDGIVDTADVLTLAPPVFFSTSGSASYSARKDLVPDGIIDTQDVLKMGSPIFFRICSP